MSTASEQQHNPREGTRQLIEKMLKEREQMLALMCKVSGLQPYTHDKSIKEELEEFNEILMDYIAAGHFGLYERIAEGTERRVAVLEEARKIYPRIDDTTQLAVSFNDKYDGMPEAEIGDQLINDMPRLAEELADRIDLEDRLINVMLD